MAARIIVAAVLYFILMKTAKVKILDECIDFIMKKKRWLLAKKVFAEERTDTQDIWCNYTETDNKESQRNRQYNIKNKIALVWIQESTDGRYIWHKEEMQQIDVERATTYILQTIASKGELREMVFIMTEIHEYDDK